MKKSGALLIVFIGIIIIILPAKNATAFGFYAHRTINRMAIFALPPDMISFYKNHIEYITEHAIDPDKRSRSVKGEDVKHYIDIEHFGQNPFDSIPQYWNDAVLKYTEDSLQKYGINPWWINKMLYSLQEAFKEEDLDRILYLSANIGHYIADACTPLHTSEFYDGKSFEQKGIHAFWETRIPELNASSYNFWVGRAYYIEKPQNYIWSLIQQSHLAVDTIFDLEIYLKQQMPEGKIYVYEEKGQIIKRQFSANFVEQFEKLSLQMVERQMSQAILSVANIWLTAYINAGQPDLSRLQDKEISKVHKQELDDLNKMWKTGKPIGRPNPEDTEE